MPFLQFIESTLTDIITNGPGIDDLILSELTNRIMILAPVFRHRLFEKMYLDNARDEEIMRQRWAGHDNVRKQALKVGLPFPGSTTVSRSSAGSRTSASATSATGRAGRPSTPQSSWYTVSPKR